MKTKKTVTLAIFVLFILALPFSTLAAQSRARRSARSSPTFQLTVNSNVRSAQVYLNGNLQKATIPFNATLDGGTYSITLKAPGYQDGNATVNLNSNQNITINLQPLKATIIPSTQHPDFVIIVDGKQQGSGPIKVDPGNHTIEFRIGALSTSGTYSFEAGKSYRVQPTLGIDFDF